MDTLVKSLLYIGTVMTLGAGIFTWFVAPETLRVANRRRQRWGLLVGAAIVLVLSPLQIVVTVTDLLGSFDPVVGLDYLFSTRHGTSTLLRLGTVLLVVAATLFPMPRTGGRALFAVSGLLLLGTFSWTSHAVAVGGTLPLLGDLLHFASAALWAGAVLYTAWLPFHDSVVAGGAAETAVGRVSRIGLASVALLALSGAYTALLHVRTPEVLTASPYGRVLILKNLLVLLIVAVAAVNRWWFLPRLRANGPSPAFIALFRCEALLLLLVLAITGVLTTSALPHEPGVRPDPLESLRNFLPL